MDEVASRWTQLDEEAKEPYRVKAQMDKARYDRQLQEYKSRQHMSPQAEKENQAAAPEPQPEPCLKLTHQSSQSSCLTEPFTPVQESLEEKFFSYKDPALDEPMKPMGEPSIFTPTQPLFFDNGAGFLPFAGSAPCEDVVDL